MSKERYTITDKDGKSVIAEKRILDISALMNSHSISPWILLMITEKSKVAISTGRNRH